MTNEWLNDVNWFAVHTKRYREAVAAASVRALGLEVFLPMVKVNYPPRGAIKVESKPLFAGYFFARFIPAVSLDSVASARGVLHVIKSAAYPIPVEEQIIQEIQDRVDSDGLIELRCDALRPGDRVSIQEGPLAGMMGRVEAELNDQRRVAILLEALCQARVWVDKRWVEAEAA